HHRTLHSFPTRRSSDLTDPGSAQVRFPPAAPAVSALMRRSAVPSIAETLALKNNETMDHQQVIDFWFAEIKPAQWWGADADLDQDRKSTRLNSSHVSIS